MHGKIRIWRNELSIEGSRGDLFALADAIRGGNNQVDFSVVEVEGDKREFAPLIPAVAEVAVGKVVISVDPGGCRFSGERIFLDELSDTIERFAQGLIAGNSSHIHLESFPGHFYLREGSTPLIIELTET